jgi:rod shape-determining protein MreC
MFKKYRLLIIAFAIGALGFFLYPTGALNPAKDITNLAISPFAKVGNVTASHISSFFRGVFQLGTSAKENQLLIKENLDLQSQITILKEVQHENEILKSELGLSRSIAGNYKMSPASIIGRASTGYLKTVTIDRGSNDGIKLGQAVISQGYLVGTIKNVYENTSEVSLITDYNSIVPVLLQESRGTGLLRGGLSGLTVEEIPLNISITPGEQVITSGLGGDIPPGISVGKVAEVVSKEGEIFQKVTVSSPIQIYFLEFVFVVNA